MLKHSPAWTQPKDLQKQVQRLWDRGLILESLLNEAPIFPIRLVLKAPTSNELSENFDQVRQWILSLQNINGLRLEMKTIQHRVLGENQIPASIWVDSLDNVSKILRVEKDIQKFSELIALTKKNNSILIPWLQDHSIKALQLATEWVKLLAVVDWLKVNPRPAIYIRQVDISCVDTKFIEKHRKILTTLLDLSLQKSVIDQAAKGTRCFAQRYGFLDKPARVRFRILDPDIRLLPGQCQDITLNHEAFSCLNENEAISENVTTLIITENEINYLAFPKIKSSIVLFGSGYGFEFLTDVSWLSQLTVYYWGDIDTHGFAILDQLRAKLPQAESLLMDEATLLNHKVFWEQESKPERRELTRLTHEENRLYHQLINNKLAQNLRLEQEKISYTYLLSALRYRELL